MVHGQLEYRANTVRQPGFSGASVTKDENAIHDETPSGRTLFALVDEDACVRTRVRDNSTSHLGG